MAEVDLEQSVSQAASRTAPSRFAPSPAGGVVPTDDPAAALRFCRQLAEMLRNETALYGDADGSVAPPAPESPELSVVVPVFNERENLELLYARLSAVLGGEGLRYELIFVDDGSRDGSLELLNGLARRDARVVVVELARNFGHQVAISAGLDHARGAAVAIMDADLQDPPEVLPRFIETWRAGHDVVYAIRERRKEGLAMRVAYAAFYRLLQRVAQIEIPLDAGDFCLMDRRVVDLLNGMPERSRFVRGIRSWVGLSQVGVRYERQGRNAGRPKYTVSRLIYLALDGLVSFSFLPLRVITLLGFAVSLTSIVLAAIYAIQRLTVGLSPPGFATLTVAIFFLSGIQLVTIGVIGEYVGRIFEEVKQRPLYVVRRVTGRG
jgi:polyisoprenyl-phosphate glycosyltransferase